MSALDEDALRAAIGREERAADIVTPRLAGELEATLGEEVGLPLDGTPAPLALHWCLAPPIVTQSALGPDGHPVRGGFLPPVPLPRRMWAGSQIEFHDALRIGDTVTRISLITDVRLKTGRAGRLCFVTVAHRFETARGVAVTESQDIVYLDPPAPDSTPPPPSPPREAHCEAQWREPGHADAVVLFRYSAVTFNGHRIHYDFPYVTGAEFYPGLIVHGPLQATMLLRYAARLRGRPPARFSFRGLQPLFAGTGFELCAAETAEGLDLWVRQENGAISMRAEARFA